MASNEVEIQDDRMAKDESDASAGAYDIVMSMQFPPVIPPVATQVLGAFHDSNADLHKLERVISKDQALSLRILSVANSAYYAGPRTIRSLSDAVARLGAFATRTIVMAAAMKRVFEDFQPWDIDLWQHSYTVSLAARAIMEVQGELNEPTYLAALFHDIGKLVLRVERKWEYDQVMQLVSNEGYRFTTAEQKVFGFDHALVGALLLTRLGIPEEIARAVGAHHELGNVPLSAKEERITATVQTANDLARSVGFSSSGQTNENWNILASPGAQLLELTDEEALKTQFWTLYEVQQDEPN